MSNKTNWIVGRMGPRQKAKARARLEQVCAVCGAKDNLTLDHKVARAHGGTNSIDNLQMLCAQCNFAKSLIEQQVSVAASAQQAAPCADEQ
jgi:5-methylcytosine-specific restriction endonuclease McrA